MDWYRITNAAGVANVDIFDAIGWYAVDAGDLARDIRALEAEQITVNINSPGGDVFDGVTILNALRQHPARTVANVMGLAASAASFIACGCDEVVMAENATMMIHDASGVVIGNAADMHEMAALLDKLSDNIAGIYASKAGGTASNWRETMRGTQWYSAQEAVDAGLADRVDGKGEAHAEKPKVDNAAPRPHTLAEARAALASMSSQPSMAANTEPASPPDGNTNRKENAVQNTEFIDGLRARLGITDAHADEATILAALDETLAEQATDTTASVPEGTVLVDKAQFEHLQAKAEQGVLAMESIDAARRDGIIDVAMREGKIAPANAAMYRAQLDRDEDGVKAIIATLTPTFSTEEKGAVGGIEADADADEALYNKAWGTAQAEGK